MRRTLLLIIVTGLVAFGAGAHAADDAKKLPKNAAVKRAIVKRDRALEQAEAAYRRAAAEANKALLVELKKAKDAAFGAKDQNEVNAVAALIEKTERDVSTAAGVRAAVAEPEAKLETPEHLLGRWFVVYGGGKQEVFLKANHLVLHENPDVIGVWFVRDGEVTLSWNTRVTDSFTLVEGRSSRTNRR